MSKSRLYYFFASLVAAIAGTWLLNEPAFNEAQVLVLFLLIFSVGLWLSEAVPPFAVGLFIMAFLAIVFGSGRYGPDGVDVSIYLNTFSSSVIWLMMGGFFLAVAMTKTRLDADLIAVTLRLCGDKPKWILLGMMAVTMFASFLISNTATTAMVIAAMMPLLSQAGQESPTSKGLILGVPLAATTGGMGTIIGSPPNAIAAGALAAAGEPVDFLEWMYYGLPVSIVLTFVGWFALQRIFLRNSPPLRFQASANAVVVDRKQRIIVTIVLIVTIALWLSNPVHGFSASAVSALPLIALTLTGVITGKDVRAMGWDTLLLVAGGLSLGTGLQQSGLLDIYASRIAALQMPELLFYFILAYATMIFSNVMSSTAISAVLIPLGLAIAPGSKTEVVMIIGLAISTALFLPVTTPPNAIAYTTGLIRQKDFMIGGLLVGLLGPPLIVLWVLLVG